MDLKAARRAKMKPNAFALSDKRFPINDRNHARLAIGGATRAERAGNITAAQAAEVKAKARAKLGTTKTAKKK
jgi:hypothetical protein